MMKTDGRDGATGAAFRGPIFLVGLFLSDGQTPHLYVGRRGKLAPEPVVPPCESDTGARGGVPFEVPPPFLGQREGEFEEIKSFKGTPQRSPSFTKEKRREETEKGPDERAMSGRLAGWGWARHRPSVRRPGAWLPGFPDFPPWPPPLLDRGVRDAPPRRLLPWSLSALSGSREDNEGVFPTGGKPSIVSSL